MTATSQTLTQRSDDIAPATTDADPSDPRGARLAADVRAALRSASYVPADDVDVEVRDHAVYLSGMVKWDHQRIAAERAVKDLAGVHVLRNEVRVLPRASAPAIQAKILDALQYDPSTSGHRVDVEVDDESVTLIGTVASYTDRRMAEDAALSMPHVRSVVNKLRIVKP